MLFRVALALSLILVQASQVFAAKQAKEKDALALLNEVSQRYADAKSYHIEAVEERNSSNELERSWQKTILKAVVVPGGKYRYEGRSGYGGAIVVSDGSTVWDYHVYEHDYTQKPGNEEKQRVIPQEEMPLMTARNLATITAHRADRLKSAALLGQETVPVGGRKVRCYVVHYSDDDLKKKRDDLKSEWTIWIDKENKTVVKTLNREHTYLLPNRIPIFEETTVTYGVVELGQQEPEATFRFTPPADAKLVEKFPDPFHRSAENATASLLGKPAPELTFKGADGNLQTLSGFRGKPVFLEFWATWCEPCVDLIGDLKQLYAETGSKGLIWISVDSDEDATTATQFLSREHVVWPNYHDEGGTLGKLVQREGIPLGILIDSEGKVTFYESGYRINELRAAIAKLGPEFGSVAKAGPASSANPVKPSE